MLISAPGTPMAELGLDRSTAPLGLSRFRLGVSIPRLNIRRIFADVLLVDPGIPVSDPAEG
jgi:hypothetical protein